jgi:hypothetical protein
VRQLEAVRSELVEARRHWGERADPAGVAAWFASIAEVDFLAGRFGAALKDAGYARRVSASDAATAARALRVIGLIQVERGNPEAGEQCLRESALLEAGSASATARADLGWSLVERGLAAEGIALLEAAQSNRSAWIQGRFARALTRLHETAAAERRLAAAEQDEGFGWIQAEQATAELALARGDAKAALAAAGALCDRLREAGVRAYMGDALLTRAAALGQLGRTRERSAVHAEIRELALALGAGRLQALLR